MLCHEIIASYGGNRTRLHEYGRRFAEEARRIGAGIVFYASGDVEGQRAQHEPMHTDAAALARACGGRVAGGGAAWLKAWRERPDLDFHAADRAHANDHGYYLNACVVYAAFTDRSPVGLAPSSLAPTEAAFLQRIAWEQYHEDRRVEVG